MIFTEKKIFLRGIYDNVAWNFYISKLPPDESKITAVVCVPILEDKIILVKHRERGWELPGGHRKDSESLSDAIIREMEEETGCVVEEPKIFGYQEFNYTKKMKNYPFPKAYILYYFAYVSQFNSSHGYKNEIIEVGSYSIQTCVDTLTLDFQKKIVNIAFDIYKIPV